MVRLSLYGAAALGLLVSLGPVAAQQLFPSAVGLSQLGIYVLGGLIGFSACRPRMRRR
jgi:hypothetical protein